MEGASREAIPRLRDQAVSVFAALANAASLRGLGMVAIGGTVMLLPTATTWLAQTVVIVALALTGLMDLFYAVTGRRWLGKRVNRWLAAARGLATTPIAAVLAAFAWIDPTGETLSLLIVVSALGLYVGVRGLIAVISAVAQRGESHRGTRLAGGGIAIVLGSLAFLFPDQIATAVIVTLATAALIVGFILIAWGLRRAETGSSLDPAHASVTDVVWDWIRASDVGNEARGEQIELLYFENPNRHAKLGTWWFMLALSVAIATYAVLADSTAVVIGAMLVAPLMTPIVALAGALVNGWARRAFHSAALVGAGVAGSILLAFGVAAWTPVAITFSANSQITSRVDPTTIDMLIALAAGAAGAYATVNKRVSSSIAGVAIAVALVPPLAVVGVSLSADRVGDATGAFLLFLTNFVAIVLAACVVFVLTGFAQPWVLRARQRSVLLTLSPFVVLAGLVLLPLMFTSQGQLSRSANERTAERAVESWLGEDSGFVIQQVTVGSEGVEVTVEGSGDTPPPEDLQASLDEQLIGDIALRLIVIPVEVTELPGDGVDEWDGVSVLDREREG